MKVIVWQVTSGIRDEETCFKGERMSTPASSFANFAILLRAED
jgi:hypothetical protein